MSTPSILLPRRYRLSSVPLVLLVTALLGCGGGGGTAAGGSAGAPTEPPPAQAWVWDLPPGFSPPVVPADNPMNSAKVELGRHLFHDVRLSGNGTQACSSCHAQANAFAENRALPRGSTG